MSSNAKLFDQATDCLVRLSIVAFEKLASDQPEDLEKVLTAAREMTQAVRRLIVEAMALQDAQARETCREKSWTAGIAGTTASHDYELVED